MSDLLGRQRLVFNQKAKVIELNIDFAISDTDGNEVGRIRQEGQSKLKKFARLVSSVDQFMTHKLAVYDMGGAKVVEHTRPAKILMAGLELLHPGHEWARGGSITKTWEGLAKTFFTTADNYLLEVNGHDLPSAMRQLILASAAGVDLALKQDSRGLS